MVMVVACASVDPGPPPTISSGEPVIGYRIGDDRQEASWTLAPEIDPDILIVDLEEGQEKEVCFWTDVEELCRTTRIGDVHDLVVLYNGIEHKTRIEGRKAIPAAIYSSEYMEAHGGKISVEVPQAYELVNVAIALTEYGRNDRWLVYKDSTYYKRLMEYFGAHLDHPFVLALDEQLQASPGRYARLKMNGFAFEYDEDGDIRRSSIYDRTGFRGNRDNALLPFFEEMKAFSRDTDFREFYEQERTTYEEQIRFYQEEVDLEAMKSWLGRQFPAVTPYDSVRILFSPLVYGSQSVTWFEQDGFRELIPNVNYPYRRIEGVRPESETVYRGKIVFTELNHGYINPTADQYKEEVTSAVTDVSFWGDERSTSSYRSPMAMFNEYMNWGLVSLYCLDHTPAEDHQELLRQVDSFMGERGRGFVRFDAFNAFLVDVYQNRGDQQTIADLYPSIIEWFAEHERSASSMSRLGS
jgi:hypothetical protein